MRRHWFLALGFLAAAAPLSAQHTHDSMITTVHKLSGPRIGLGTSLGTAGDARLAEFNVSAPYVQFGWVTEQRAFPHRTGGLAFVFQETWLIGAADQGKLLPSVSGTMGIRSAGGVDVGIGPELSVHGMSIGAMVGYAFQAGDVVIPVSATLGGLDRQPHLTVLVGFAWESIRR